MLLLQTMKTIFRSKERWVVYTGRWYRVVASYIHQPPDLTSWLGILTIVNTTDGFIKKAPNFYFQSLTALWLIPPAIVMESGGEKLDLPNLFTTARATEIFWQAYWVRLSVWPGPFWNKRNFVKTLHTLMNMLYTHQPYVAGCTG